MAYPANGTSSLALVSCTWYQFMAPPGWKYTAFPDEVSLVYTPFSAWMLVYPHGHTDLKELEADILHEPLDVDMQLSVEGSSERITHDAVGVTLAGTVNDAPAKARLCGGLSPFSGGVFVFACTKFEEYFRRVAENADTIIKTIQYQRIDISDLTSYLVGIYVNRMGSRIHLLSNGGFFRRCEPDYIAVIYNPYGDLLLAQGIARQTEASGRWSAVGDRISGMLTVRYPDHSKEMLTYCVCEESGSKPSGIRLRGEYFHRT